MTQISISYPGEDKRVPLKHKKINTFGSNITYPRGAVIPLQTARELKDAGAPIKLKQENRGNEELAKLYEELGLTQAVSGHFHESGHRANDLSGHHVDDGEWARELFWNSGHLDIGQTGILTVGDGKLRYRNIRFA